MGGCGRQLRFDGGIFAGGYACVGGVSVVIPVDVHIPGCPPTPLALLKGLLALMTNGRGLPPATSSISVV